MSLYVLSYEATTSVECSREAVYNDALEGHRLGFDACRKLTDDLRKESLLADPVVSIIEAYATGEDDDWSDGQLTTFVRVSMLVEADSQEAAEEAELVPLMLEAIYNNLNLPDTFDGDFEFTDVEAADGYSLSMGENQEAYAAYLATLDPQAIPAP